jgi:nucleoside-diphosphate-sugar epimerase
MVRRSGTVYNVAWALFAHDIFRRLAHVIGVEARAEVVPELARTSDLPHLVGDATRLKTATGWKPLIPFDQTLQDVADAQTD